MYHRYAVHGFSNFSPSFAVVNIISCRAAVH